MKKMISVMLVIGMMLCFSGCGEIATSNPMADMYYDDEQLSNYYNDFEMTEYTQQISGNKISGTYCGFNGMVALWVYEDEGGFPLDVKHMINVRHGKVKLILYYTDGEVTTVDMIEEFNNNFVSDEMEASTVVLKEGLSCIKLVGTDSADVEFEIEINGGSFIGIE